MPFYVIYRRHPGTLGQAKVVDQDGVAHAHAVKGVPAQRWHFNSRFGRVDGKGRVQHGRSPAMGSCLNRHQILKLEDFFVDFFESVVLFTKTNFSKFTTIARITH